MTGVQTCALPIFFTSGGKKAPDDECPPGYYCPSCTSYANQFARPDGTWNPHYGHDEHADCYDCLRGMPTLPAAPVYYLPLPPPPALSSPVSLLASSQLFFHSSSSSFILSLFLPPPHYHHFPLRHSASFHCFTDAVCDPGHYCEFGFTVPVECPVGTYMPWGVNTTVPDVASGTLVTDHYLAGAGNPAKRQFECLDCPGG